LKIIPPFFDSEISWSEVSEGILRRLQLKIEERLQKASLYRKRMSEDVLRTKSWERISNSSESPPRLVAINEGHGRLGNYLFRVASLVGIARTDKRIPVSLTKDQRVELFAGLEIGVLNETEVLRITKKESLPRVVERGASIYTSVIGNLSKIYGNSSVLVSGYLQSWKYFHKFESEIRAMLTFSREIWKNSTAVIRGGLHWLEEENKRKKYRGLPELVGIHVRRTDVAFEPINLKKGYVAASDEYLVETVRHVLAKHREILLFVVTDDVNYCRKTLKDFDNLVFSVQNSPEVDMAILALMDTVIMTVGSFGWWGAYLSDARDVFYYKDWPLKKSILRKFTHHRDYFLPNWQGRS
jgi:galactoside 2-L-fucosyltransferase 1/2